MTLLRSVRVHVLKFDAPICICPLGISNDVAFGRQIDLIVALFSLHNLDVGYKQQCIKGNWGKVPEMPIETSICQASRGISLWNILNEQNFSMLNLWAETLTHSNFFGKSFYWIILLIKLIKWMELQNNESEAWDYLGVDVLKFAFDFTSIGFLRWW